MNEYEEHLNRLLQEVRTAYRARRSMQKIKPQVMIGNDRTLSNLLEHMFGYEPNWREQVFIQVLEEEEDTVIRVIRSIDMPSGEVVIL